MSWGKIYVTNFAGHKIKKAFEHTNLSPAKAQINLTEGNIDIFNTDRLIFTIKEKIRDSSPDDFLLLCGPSMISCIAFGQWLEKHGMVHLLIYHAKKKNYILREIMHCHMYVDL